MKTFILQNHIQAVQEIQKKYIIGVGFLGIEKFELENLYETFEEWKNTEKYIGAEYRKNTKYISDIKNINLKTKTINDILNLI